jgi:endonuclease-3
LHVSKEVIAAAHTDFKGGRDSEATGTLVSSEAPAQGGARAARQLERSGALDVASRSASYGHGMKKTPRGNSGIARTGRGFSVTRALTAVKRLTDTLQVPVVTLAAEISGDPWEVLAACLLSLRTKDAVTAQAVKRLFARARTTRDLLALPEAEIAELIYPVGFYKTKAKVLRDVARTIEEKHGGRVPDDLDALLELKGVGRKTANLVVTQAFGKPGICVDTHVHRIMNRWGYVATRSPDETEHALRAKLPRKWWIPVNPTLVAFGQGICGPISPLCSRCPVAASCPRIGVQHSR